MKKNEIQSKTIPWMDQISRNRTKIRRALLRWFKNHARDLPWRCTREAYPVWLSEIMLQTNACGSSRALFLNDSSMRFRRFKRWQALTKIEC